MEKEPELLLKVLRAEKASIIEVKHADGAMIVSRIAKLWEVEGAKEVDFTVKAMRTEEPLWWQDDTNKLLKNDPVSWKTMIEAMTKAGFLKSGKPEDFYTDASRRNSNVSIREPMRELRVVVSPHRSLNAARFRNDDLTRWSNVNKV